jgi:hypothetical protein
MNIIRAANIDTQGVPYRCLGFATAVFSVPNKYEYATAAWKATEYGHSPSEPLPDVPVPVWFSWSGTIPGGGYGDWGHVAVWVPGRGVLSSPFSTNYKQQWFDTPQKLIAYLGSGTYVGWSEDINDVRVADVTVKEEAVYPNKQDVIDVLADRGVAASQDEQEKWGTNKFRWPEFWKDVKRAYPVPLATTPDFVRTMCRARGFEPSEDEVKKWSNLKAADFMNDLVKQYPLDQVGNEAQRQLDKIKALLKESL